MTLRMLAIASFLWLTFPDAAIACSGGPCDEDRLACLPISRSAPQGCLSGVPWLDPGNDSRTYPTMIYQAVLGQIEGTNELYKDADFQEATPTRSNSPESVNRFKKGVEDASLPEELRQKLVSARDDLAKDPVKFKTDGLPPGEFSDYLRGAAAFYQDRPDEAATIFAKLQEARSPWIREVALYLTGRAYMVASQKEWEGYSEPEKKTDLAKLKQAEEAFAQYEAKFPQGEYLRSAAGLLRRIAYLKGDRKEQSRRLFVAFEEAIAKKLKQEQIQFLATELDRNVAFTGQNIP